MTPRPTNSISASAIIALASIILIYALFRKRFFRLNRALNQQKERQVQILSAEGGLSFARHLRAIRRHEVSISDTEAVVYGLIYLGLLGFILFNLWFATTLITPSAGDVFSIITYSTSLLEASIALPMALQTATRLAEISERINRDGADP